MKATLEGRRVQVTRAATVQTTMTALRGWPLWTRETQLEKGRTPSRATAKTRREEATMAMAVFCRGVRVCFGGYAGWRRVQAKELQCR